LSQGKLTELRERIEICLKVQEEDSGLLLDQRRLTKNEIRNVSHADDVENVSGFLRRKIWLKKQFVRSIDI
tara:strand:- start:38 stop:250 length:213 start_codon:yes stop_codon:yes gene_type:complete